MRNYFFTLFCILLPYLATAQAFHIQGKLVDSDSQLPVDFATIYVAHENKGTISNEEGVFSLEVNQLPCTLLIYHLSYQRDTICVHDTNHVEISLIPSPIILEEVTVNYIENLLARVHANMQDDSTQLYSTTFYRQTTRLDSKRQPTEIKEMFYWTASDNKGMTSCVLDQGRYARTTGSSFTNFSQYTKTLRFNADLLLVGQPATQHLSYTRGQSFDQGKVVEIKYGCEQCKNIGSLYIDTQNNTLLRWRFDLFENTGFWALSSSDSNAKIDVQKYVFDINYRTINSITIVESLKVDLYFTKGEKRKMQQFHVSSIAWFYDYTTSPKLDITYQTVLEDDFAAIKNKKYDAPFWENNPVITRTSGEKAAIKLFEKDKIFETNVRQ